jgi:hypothetical protein
MDFNFISKVIWSYRYLNVHPALIHITLTNGQRDDWQRDVRMQSLRRRTWWETRSYNSERSGGC